MNVDLLREIAFSRLRKLYSGEQTRPCDLKLMIKDEPHKVDKIKKGRERLIWVLALEDQVVDRWIFGSWFSEELRNYEKTNSKTGWSPLPFGVDLFERTFRSKATRATDFSSYDWTWTEQLLFWVFDTYLQQLRLPKRFELAYIRAAWRRLAEVMGPSCVVRLPTGERFRQRGWGIMKSGWLLTLLLNGRGVAHMFYAAWVRMFPGVPPPPLWSMGDDMLVVWNNLWDFEPIRRMMEEFGVIIKFVSDEKEFAGFKFPRPGVVTPSYENKHRFILAYTSPSDRQELIDAYALLYALSDSPFADWIRERQTHPPSLVRAWARGLIPSIGHASYPGE